MIPLQWRHNGRDGVSNHQPHDCLLNRLFRHRSKKAWKLCATGLCEGNSPVTGEFPTQRANDAEKVPIWWHHYAFTGHQWFPSQRASNAELWSFLSDSFWTNTWIKNGVGVDLWHLTAYVASMLLHWFAREVRMKNSSKMSIHRKNITMLESRSGPWFNKKIPSWQYRKSHCGDKTVVRPSYVHNGITYTGSMASLYWIMALESWEVFPLDIQEHAAPRHWPRIHNVMSSWVA